MKECEYCFTHTAAHKYITEDGESGMKLEIQDNGLYIELHWPDEHTKEMRGMAALALIRYCPWCGRPLGGEKYD